MMKLFEDDWLVVETNGCGDVFVRPKRDPRAEVRICPDQLGLVLTAHYGQLIASATNGLPAVLVRGR
jgi:hypothetical protein